MQIHVIWILTALLFILTLKIFVSKNIVSDVKKRYDTSYYEFHRPLPKRINEKFIDLMKDEQGGKAIEKFVALRPKIYCYLTDDDMNVKKPIGTKKCLIKRILKFNDYKDCQFKNEIILNSQQRFNSEPHCVYIEQVNKIALSNNDDKRLQTFGGIKTYPYGKNALKVYKSEMLSKHN